MKKSLIITALLSIVISISACGKKDAVRKLNEKGAHGDACCPAQPGMTNTMAIGSVPEGSLDGLKWAAPSGWKSKGATGMRLDTLTTASGLECTIIPLGAQSGTFEANITRWLGQMAVNADAAKINDFAKNCKEVTTAGGVKYRIADLSQFSTKGDVILAAMSVFNDGTLFIKVSGPKDKISADKKAFTALCDSLKR